MSKLTIGGVILAGGKSSRMGSPKELLDWQGRPLLLHLVDGVQTAGLPCLVISNTPDRLPLDELHLRGVQISTDLGMSHGPISGIHTAFSLLQEDALLILSCDLPFIEPEDVQNLVQMEDSLADYDAILSETQGQIHPFVALYHRRTMPFWEEALKLGQYKVMKVIDQLKVNVMKEGTLSTLATFNMNTPEQYRFACEKRRSNHAISTRDSNRRGSSS